MTDSNRSNKSCDNCKYNDAGKEELACCSCLGLINLPQWKPKDIIRFNTRLL